MSKQTVFPPHLIPYMERVARGKMLAPAEIAVMSREDRKILSKFAETVVRSQAIAVERKPRRRQPGRGCICG